MCHLHLAEAKQGKLSLVLRLEISEKFRWWSAQGLLKYVAPGGTLWSHWKVRFEVKWSKVNFNKNSQYSNTAIKSLLWQISMSLMYVLIHKTYNYLSVVLCLWQFNAFNFSRWDTMVWKKEHWINVWRHINHLHICYFLCLLIHRFLNLGGPIVIIYMDFLQNMDYKTSNSCLKSINSVWATRHLSEQVSCHVISSSHLYLFALLPLLVPLKNCLFSSYSS